MVRERTLSEFPVATNLKECSTKILQMCTSVTREIDARANIVQIDSFACWSKYLPARPNLPIRSGLTALTNRR